MDRPLLKLPQPVPIQRMRATQPNVPSLRAERDRLRTAVKQYVDKHRPVPPMGFDELRHHAESILDLADADLKYVDYTAVLVNNEAWHDTLAPIPYERRLLLMPKCLRDEDKCPAPFDEFGLLCKQCGLCSIQDLQVEAERLGYAVLVAEGSAVVTKIIETGKIDAIVGVSCLSVLEKAFPFMEAAAVPGIAIPLLQDDCRDTNVDLDWVWDVIHLTSDDKTDRLDLDGVRREVEEWFAPEGLDEWLGPADSETERIGREWLGKSGKRWRPFLAVCVYQALQNEPGAPLPADLRKVATAVECFHKASLIHDDIEDGDSERYGEKTLHEAYGVPVALNAGDFLLGEGYRLIGACDAEPTRKVRMLQAAAAGHRTLSLGQGAELCWARTPEVLSSVEVLDIFRRKTAPAFEVALQLGAHYGGADDDVSRVLAAYSEALGIAYQIRDDADDWVGGQGDGPDDLQAMRPSLMLAVAHERARGEAKKMFADLWRRSVDPAGLEARIAAAFEGAGVPARVRRLYESYKEEAIRSLRELENATLKGLLRRIVAKIFRDLEIKGWCREFEASDAAGGGSGAESAA